MMKCLYIGIFSVLAWVIGERFAKFFPSIYTTGNYIISGITWIIALEDKYDNNFT